MKSRRILRGWAIVVGVVVAGVLLARLVADPIAARVVRDWLAEHETLEGKFSDVHVTFLPPGIQLHRLKIHVAPVKPRDEALPLLYVERFEGRLAVGQLLQGKLRLKARIEEPKINYALRGPVKSEVEATAKKLEEPLYALLALLRKLPPYRIDRAEVFDAEVLVLDAREPEAPRLWVHGVDATVENFVSQSGIEGGDQPAIVGMSGTVEKSGAFSLFLTADPHASLPELAGRMALSGLELSELHDFMKSKAGIAMGKGTFSMVAGFRAEDGVVRGEVRPEMVGLDAKAAAPGPLNKIKAAASDVATSIIGDGKEDRIALRAPFRVNLKEQKVDIGTAVVSVLRNAFVEGLSTSLASVGAPDEVPGRKQVRR